MGGRSHMADDHPGDPTYVSRQQCIVEVADDGTASLISIGKPLTLHKPPSVDFWCGLKKTKPLGDDIGYDSAHVLTDGEQISLDMREPDAAVFTIVRKEERVPTRAAATTHSATVMMATGGGTD